MTRTILLARHGVHAEVGHILSGRSEIALSPDGHAQAERLAAWLDRTPLASIHVSPRARTRQTAEPVARRRGLTPVIAPALDEIDFGTFTGQSFAALGDDPAWTRWNAERDTARCPDGETMSQAVERAWRHIHTIPASDAPALCVTHCDVIRGVIAWHFGLPFTAIYGVDCDPGSVTTLELSDTGTRLVALNERP
ncbi:histidine phosphatase family protein [Sphingomonas sp. Mn802worker]|uniref:histidine phosphatase family protein n=1 Tax=Sphingomonas sp. Mn802worker TaxID=629773 RepID=UPI00036790EB|nr:histidine phosphatase family protein [Sphingomonas sp. Mn802worker]